MNQPILNNEGSFLLNETKDTFDWEGTQALHISTDYGSDAQTSPHFRTLGIHVNWSPKHNSLLAIQFN